MLSETPPVSHELIYSNHARGFALCSMRSATRSRYYVQCSLTTASSAGATTRSGTSSGCASTARPPSAGHRPVDREEHRAAAQLRRRADALRPAFLAGDAAHIVPPTGAKGLNLAAGDVGLPVARAAPSTTSSTATPGIDGYSERRLRRVWRAERFSWWFTSLMHKFPEDGAFGQKMQAAELDYLVHSRAASTALAENYVGLPYEKVPGHVEQAWRHPGRCSTWRSRSQLAAGLSIKARALLAGQTPRRASCSCRWRTARPAGSTSCACSSATTGAPARRKVA